MRYARSMAAIFGLFCVPMAAAEIGDRPLAEIREELARVRAEAPQHEETRGASARLTTVKHLLRDWIEARLGEIPSDPNRDDGADRALAASLNAELREEHLFRESSTEAEDWSVVGSVAPVSIEYRLRQSYLVVQTAIRVQCGFDESAYLYGREGASWKRVWASEQNVYTEAGYEIQAIHAVHMPPPFAVTAPHVLTLGTAPWCSSNWRGVYVRLFRVDSSAQPSCLLLDSKEAAFLGVHDVPILGSVGREDALIEYRVGSIDSGVHNRARVLHYAIKPEGVERIEPIALGPRDFVEEWLTQPWEQSKRWSLSSVRMALRKSHTEPRGDEFLRPSTQRCRTPCLWQVGIGFEDGRRPPTYYLVRWEPPYHFTMVRASRQPSPSCTQEDAAADDSGRTLFPVQEWRE